MRTAITYLLLFFTLLANAQGPALYFRNLTTSNGLSNNKVNCILQDKRGFTWLGTDDGLNRYDGNRFLIFRHDAQDSTTISGNIITDMLEDKEGVLWITTADGGLSRYDYRLPPAKQFRQYKNEVSDSSYMPGNIVNALTEDRAGFLWLATSGQGVLKFDKKTGKFAEPVRRRARTNLDLAMDHDGKIWVGRQGGGLLKVDPVTQNYDEDPRYMNVYAGLPHMTITTIFGDSRRNMWLGTWDKVIYRFGSDNREQVYKDDGKPGSYKSDDPLSFAEDANHRVWIGGTINGLQIFNPATETFQQYKHNPAQDGSLADNRVNCIYIDKSGIVWAGTNRGVSVHDPTQQQFVQTFLPMRATVNNGVYDFVRNGRGAVLIGSSSGISEFENGKIIHHVLKFKGEELAATKFFRDTDGSLYVGTNVSLYRLNLQTYQLTQLPNTDKDVVMNRIVESRVVSMMRDSIDGHPVLIVSPYGHYFTYYDFVTERWVTRQDSTRMIVKNFNIRDNLIRKFYVTRDGQIWIATSKLGLGEWHRGPKGPRLEYFIHVPGQSTSISNNQVFDIAEDIKGNLWVSTYGGGLHYFNTATREFQHIPGSHNLAEGIQTDGRGNVWMIANGNLHKYDPHRKTYSSYELPDLERSGGVKGYIFKDEKGRMYLAGSNYFISFHPDSIRDISLQPKVFLTDFKVFNNSYSELLFNRHIDLEHNENYFSMEFAAPSYQAGYPVQYSHKLEGVDADWVEDGTLNSVNYTNLDGGDYTFKVRATVKPGVWSNETSSIRVRIIPPFWKTWWFFAICTIASALLVFGLYRYRINELVKRQSIRNKIAQDLHDNVGSTLSSISVYSQVAKIYKQQDKQESLADALDKISSTSSEMISEMNDIVWAINPRNDNMATILSRMESFARPLLASKEIKFNLTCDPTLSAMHLEMTKRKNFYLIFKEAINNALKYAECRNIWVNIELQDQQLMLKVKDDGKGFDTGKVRFANSLSGNGLRNMKLRATENRGSYTVESAFGLGTTITLRFPIP